MFWKCSCGQKFEETGDRKGWGSYSKHGFDACKGFLEGEHNLLGLFDAKGELLVQGRNIRGAISKGYVTAKDKEPALADLDKHAVGMPYKATPFKGQMRFITVDLPPELYVLYELALAKFPVEYGQATFTEWLTDCIMGFYSEHPELGFDVLFGDRPEVKPTMKS